jgi:hypothetical protein
VTENGGGAEAPPRPGAVARLLGGFANALLDLGLPTIRQWLRERVGPGADVTQVTTDGSLVHLDGVRVPLGPRGILVLDRATAILTRRGPTGIALGRAGLPEMRLFAFSGVVAFGDASRPAFRAEIAFSASPDPEDAAWISGELSIAHASWTPREGSSPADPLRGRARLFVSSREWRIEEGRLDGPIVRAQFSGRGAFESSADETRPELESPLAPRALSTASVVLEHARVGPFLDVAGALAGKTISIPSSLPLDAELEGVLSWSVTDGGEANLHVASEALRADMRARVDPRGKDLDGRLEAHVRLAGLLHGIVPLEALPRVEDVVRLRLAIDGDLDRPVVSGTIDAAELGFRLGRPRFVPPVLVHDLSAELFFKDGRAVLRTVALARGTKLTSDLDANVREPSSVRGTLRADVVDAPFLRDLLRTLDVDVLVADDVSGSLELALAPIDSGLSLSGAMTLSTPASKLVIAVAPPFAEPPRSSPDAVQRRCAPSSSIHVSGSVSAQDLLKTGVFSGALRPEDGALVVALDVSTDAGGSARGVVSTERLSLALANRPEIPPFVVEDATVNVIIDPSALVYEGLRFRGYGGRFIASGTISLVPRTHEDKPRISLHLDEGRAELVEALGRLLGDERADRSTPRRLRVARHDERPPGELWVPQDLRMAGQLRLYDSSRPRDLSLVVDLVLETSRGTSATLSLRLGNDGGVDDSTLVGAVAMADLVQSGALGAEPIVSSNGTVTVDAFARGRGDAIVVLASVAIDRVAVAVARGAGADAALLVTDVTASVRLDRERVIWKDLDGHAYGGSLASTGVYDPSGVLHASASLVYVAIDELPAFAGQALSPLVRGYVSASIVARGDAAGSFRAGGRLDLHEGAFPVLDQARPTLARYGLRPPNERAIAPVTATIVGTDAGVMLRDIELRLPGVTVRGDIGLLRARTLDGRLEVILEEEYLRSSALLALPRWLADKLVVPVRIDGPVDGPTFHAELGQCLGRFLRDNRVRQVVTSALEEAHIFMGRHPMSEPAQQRTTPPSAPELEGALRQIVESYAADWDELARHEADRHGRCRRVRLR